MADYYSGQKDYATALIYATKAYELSGSDYHKRSMERLKAKI
jgi:hypothetical protein